MADLLKNGNRCYKQGPHLLSKEEITEIVRIYISGKFDLAYHLYVQASLENDPELQDDFSGILDNSYFPLRTSGFPKASECESK